MIKNIHQIRGIGRFKDFTPHPPIELAEVNIVYGENGKGKSSLAAIFRSISSGNLDELARRTTIGTDRKSIVICRDDGSKIAYSSPGQRWSQEIDNLLVFDETFVHENVCIGPLVDIDQRRNLNTVILGNSARKLSDDYQELTAATKARTVEIRSTRQAIESKIKRPASNSGTPMSLDAFMELKPVPDFDGELERQKLHVDHLRSFSEVLSLSEFARAETPEFPIDDFGRLLKSSIEDVEANAEAHVQAHLGMFSDNSLEDWIEQGTGFSSGARKDCPYCGQPLRASSLIAHYQAYFSEAYKTLKYDIKEFTPKRLQFDAEMDSANRAIADNARLSDTWRKQKLNGLADYAVNFDDVRLALTTVLNQAKTLLEEKANRPLESLELSAEFYDAHETWNQVCEGVAEYNRIHDENNEKIRKHKGKLVAGNLQEAEQQLLELENTSIRYSDEVSPLCDKYSQQMTEQQSDNQRKDDIQARIEQEVTNTYNLCGQGVNKFLRRLNADFKLKNLKQRRDGTNRQAQYHIGLFGAEIPVGGDKLAKTGQSYKNTLSEGDRRTLALALFLATLERNEKLEHPILVFDDPVTSMDDNRSSATADLILELCEKDKNNQVIVLSHRKRFLKNLWKKYNKKGQDKYGFVRLLEVTPKEGDTDISEIRPNWDIRTATESDFDQDLRYIVEYIGNSPKTDKRNAAPKLRVILENHYKSLYPDEYTDNITTFGEFINRVETCPEGGPLVALKTRDLPKLKRLNDATSTFHHSKPLDVGDTELRQYCRDTLDLVGRRY